MTKRRVYMCMVAKKWTSHRVAGVYYHRDAMGENFNNIRARWETSRHVGVSIYLERDPGNRYDANAIRVMEQETNCHIGWIPKEENAMLAMIMDKLELNFSGFLTAKTNFDNNKWFIDLFLHVPESMKHLCPPEPAKPEAIKAEPVLATSIFATVPVNAVQTKPSVFADYELDI